MDAEKVFLVWHHHDPGTKFLEHIASTKALALEFIDKRQPPDHVNCEIEPVVIDGKYEG